eukprot:403355809
MGTIIARNEEIERELKIVTRALELREDSTRNIPELEKMIAQMQNQLTLEKNITQELEYLRSQDKLEMTKMDSELKSLRDKNRDLQKQVELSGNLLEDKIKKVDEQQDKIQTLRDELMMLSQNSEREIRQLNEEIKTQSKDNMGLSYQMKELQKQVRDQFEVYQNELKNAYLSQANRDEQILQLEKHILQLEQQIREQQKDNKMRELIEKQERILMEQQQENYHISQQNSQNLQKHDKFERLEENIGNISQIQNLSNNINVSQANISGIQGISGNSGLNVNQGGVVKINQIIEEEREKNRRLLNEIKQLRGQFQN